MAAFFRDHEPLGLWVAFIVLAVLPTMLVLFAALGPFATPETPETVFETHYDNGDWMTVEIVDGRRVTKEYRGGALFIDGELVTRNSAAYRWVEPYSGISPLC